MQFPPAESDFDEFTLADPDLIVYAIHTCSVFIMWFCVALLIFPDDTKRISWAVSLLNSFIMFVSSAVYMHKKLPPGFFALTAYGDSVFHGRDNFSATICLVFGVANVVDLLLGAIFYRSRLNVLSSLVHHPMFAFIAFYSVTGNFLGVQMSPFSQGFMWMMIEEIPTFILALGSIFPALRADKLFGASFFILRIVFHGYGTSYAILSHTDAPICAFMCLSMIFHVIWFKQWVDSYRRPKHARLSGISPGNKTRTTILGVGTPPGSKPPRSPATPSPPHTKKL